MRIVSQDDTPLLLQDAPYDGSLGASLYAAAVDPLTDPGPTAIEFRRNRILDSADGVISNVDGMYDLGASSVPKTPAIASVDSPDAEIRYAIPAAWHEKTIWANVRTHAEGYENETIYRPRRVTLDAAGDDDTGVFGTATIIDLEKRDGGGLRVRFAFADSRNGATPTGFTLTKTTGTGTIAPGTVAYTSDARVYEIDVTGLTDSVAYTFTLSATHAGGSTDLVAGIAFTGDSSGPGAVTLTAVEL